MTQQTKNSLAVVMVDMQDNFLTPRARYIVPNHVDLIRFCGKHKIPIFVIEFRGGRHPNPTTKNILREIANLPKSNYYWIPKSNMDAFAETKLEKELDRLGIKEFALTGVNAGACIFATAKTAVKKYKVMTSEDLIAANTLIESNQEEKLEWYRENTSYFETHLEVMNEMKSRF